MRVHKISRFMPNTEQPVTFKAATHVNHKASQKVATRRAQHDPTPRLVKRNPS
jgi:hypothetical protein